MKAVIPWSSTHCTHQDAELWEHLLSHNVFSVRALFTRGSHVQARTIKDANMAAEEQSTYLVCVDQDMVDVRCVCVPARAVR